MFSMYDILIKNGLIVDGSGNAAYHSDLAVKNGKIAEIAPVIDAEAAQTIDASGRIVTPGLIDTHTHSDRTFVFGTSGYNFLEQGVTTEVTGNCGWLISPVYSGSFDQLKGIISSGEIARMAKLCDTLDDFVRYVDSMDMPTNMAFYMGHGAIRGRVMEYSPAEPDQAQLTQMKDIIRRGMELGFLGMSTGLIFAPSSYAKEAELTELCKVVAEYGGIYCSHIRGESDTLLDAVAECMRIGENSGCNICMSHHKVGGKNNLGKSKYSLALIEETNARGKISVRADQYPFIAGNAPLTGCLPPKYLDNGIPALIENLKNADFRREVTAAILKNDFGESFILGCGFAGCLVLTAPFTPECVGRNLAEIADEWGEDAYDVMYDLLIKNQGNVDMAYFQQNEEDMMRILAHPTTMPCSDGYQLFEKPGRETLGGTHPRYISTMARHMHLVRENGILPMEKAIQRATSTPARFLNMPDIGLLCTGYNADIAILDWDNFTETNDYKHPYRKCRGVDWVIVNGQIAVKDGESTGVRAGKRIRRAGS